MKKHTRHHPAGEEWLAIRFAIRTRKRTIRLCAIYAVRCAAVGAAAAGVYLIVH
jgi:hypothetical protein